MTVLPLGASPLASLLLSWAHGAEPELRAGDLVRLHEDVEALLAEVGIDPDHVQRVCGEGPQRWPEGAAGGACDAGTKSDAAPGYQPTAASQD